MTNSKEMPRWFKWADPMFGKVNLKPEPLDYLALAKDISFSPMTPDVEHYIRTLLQRIKEGHEFTREPLTEDEMNAQIILQGYLKLFESAKPIICPECDGTGLYRHRGCFIKGTTCRNCNGRRRIKP